ncbi:related to transporter protein [Ramularia collo-cygni]|uniref:Related to transporter protein n=1 Tax=Ramularia collo-cygni TaxID=112498 RepID=A0A2D3VNP1_9PEZI|nr:related to transporter protein [Ramularia collo-cygni]CZT25704.1 related to transporter protein [Ramularia collo-cygni]
MAAQDEDTIFGHDASRVQVGAEPYIRGSPSTDSPKDKHISLSENEITSSNSGEEPNVEHGSSRQALEKRLVRKLDFIFLPWACLSIIIKKIDQSNYKAAYTAGMRDDLNLGGTKALNWLETYFSIPFAIFMVPSVLIMMRVRPSLWLPSLELVWGILTGCMAATSNVKHMYALRWLIGTCEASAWPGMTILLLSWYTPKEMAKRQALFLSAQYIGSMFTFAMQSAIYQTLDNTSGLPGWRWLFIINGLMTLVAAVIGYVVVPDYPSSPNPLTSWYLSPSLVATAQLRLSEIGKKTQTLTPQPVLPLLRKVAGHMTSFSFLLLFLAYAPWAWSQQTIGYFNLWLDSLLLPNGDKRFSTVSVTNIPIAGYGISVVSALIFASLSDALQVRWQLAIGINMLQLFCTTILAAWPSGFGIKMAAFMLSFLTGCNESLFMAWIGETCKDDATERAVVVAWAVALVYAGNSGLPLVLWPANEAPTYKYGYKVAAAFCGVSIMGVLGYRFLRGRKRQTKER